MPAFGTVNSTTSVATSTDVTDHTGDTADAHAASAIGFTPNGSIAATNVQAAIQEVRDEATGGGNPVIYDLKRYTGGDIALTSTSQAAVSGPGDLVVAAASGDLCMVGLSAVPVTNTAQSMWFEFATIVSAAPVNYVGARSGTPINTPVAMWQSPSAEPMGFGGEFPYVVQAGDISGGNVTFRLYCRVSGNRSINADTSNPLDIWVRNVGQ